MGNVSLCADGTIEKKLDLYGDMLYRLAFAYMKNRQDAEDILQDVFVKYMEKWPAFDNEVHEKAWFIRVTINISKNRLRSGWIRYRSEWSQEAVCEDTITDHEVLDAVLALPPKYREVIHLYYYEEYKISQISLILGKNESTVRSLLKRGREKLRKVLKEGYNYA